MNRVTRSFVRKVLYSSALAILLLSTPTQLWAHEPVQERAAQTVVAGSVLEWFAGFWSDLTAWLTGGVVPDPKPTPSSDTDSGGCLDPHGRCGG